MTWFKVDDNLAFHRKVVAAGNAAMGLWVRAGSWCAQHLTDGFIPDQIVIMLGTRPQASRLVKSGLWAQVPGGFIFHEWNENGRQPTAQKVRDLRKSTAARQAAWKRRNYGKAQVDEGGNGVTNAVTNTVAHAVSNGVTNDVPSRPDPTTTTSADDFESERSPSAAGATSAPRERGPRGTRIPDDFEVTPSMVSWARENAPHADGRIETDQFRDYWTAKSGKDATKIDWEATWRSWMRNAEKQAGRTNGAARNAERIPTTTARVAAIEALRRGPEALP